jgi:superfamily I DNA and/or RNA helicase
MGVIFVQQVHLGLKFVHLPDTVYDRGRSQVNRKEARIVAEAALDHYRKFPTKSLGIGAFNIKQQQAIQEEVELQLRLHPEMEAYFSRDRSEYCFVKNLETIQGDERDVIFLSIGFGRDAVGRMTLNFGPLNQEGGERRLNVLITRARERCVVFSNFRAGDLSLDAGSPIGLKVLRIFLDYAESRNLQTIEPTGEDTGSAFEVRFSAKPGP